jgi:arabinofuranan 3-O-arabinosyltransferase
MQLAQTNKIGPFDPAILLGIIVVLAVFQLSPMLSGDIGAALKDRDFVNYWLSGQLVFESQTSTLFGSLDSYMAALTAHMGPQVQPRYWSYPPHFLFFTAPLGLMNYFPAMAVFMAASCALFLYGARAWLGTLDAKILILLSPFIAFNLIAGQNGFLSGGLMMLGLGWRKTRPVLAGIALGALTIKPQLGILLPFLLLIERRYAVIFSAIATTIVLVAASILVFGMESWQGYLANNLPEMKKVMWEWQGIFLSFMPSLFAALRVLNIAPNVAIIVHGLFAVAIFTYCVRPFLRCEDDGLRAILVVAATFAISPYSFLYDAGPLSAAAILLLGFLVDSRKNLIVLLVALLPLAALPLGLIAMPIAPIVIIAMIVVTVQTINAGSRAASSN